MLVCPMLDDRAITPSSSRHRSIRVANSLVDAGSVETYRDDSVDYASHIWQAGGQAELHIWPGGCHNLDGTAPEATLSREARAARVSPYEKPESPFTASILG